MALTWLAFDIIYTYAENVKKNSIFIFAFSKILIFNNFGGVLPIFL